MQHEFMPAPPMQGSNPSSLDPYIVHSGNPSDFAKLPEESMGVAPVNVAPTGPVGCPIEDDILARDYEVNISKWFSESWAIYKEHWIAFSLFTIFQIVIGFIPYVGSIMALPLHFGIFIAVTNKIRYNGLQGVLRYDHLLFGYLFILPMFIMGFLELFIVAIGFLLCILPGFYFLIALSFGVLVFMEYHDQNVGLINAMVLSMKVVNKHLCEMTLFLVVNALLAISGFLLLGVGLLVTIPLASIMLALAFKDLFGLNPHKEQTRSCILC